MPASYIDAAVRKFSAEPVVCWCNGQNLESRYSSSVGAGGPAGLGKAAGNAVLRRQLASARPVSAAPMPRFPLVAVTARQILIFEGPAPASAPLVAIQRDQAEVDCHRGPLWHRLDQIVASDGGSRCYTMFVFGLSGGRKRLRRLVGELSGNAGATK